MQASSVLALLTAVLAALPVGAAPSVVFDRTSIGPSDSEPPPGRDRRALQVVALPPRIGDQALSLPVAWSAAEDEVRLEPGVFAELSLALTGLDLEERVASRLLDHAATSGEDLPLLDAGQASGLLVHERRATGGAGQHRAATERVLTRGNVRDRWTVPSSISDPDPESPPPQLPASRLLRVEIVSLGLLVDTDGASLPPRFAHLGLRARLWNLREGLREWDRAILLGRVLAEDPELGGAFRAAVEELLEAGTDLLASGLWPELELTRPTDGALPRAEGPAAPARPATARALAAPAPLPEREGLERLLERLAAQRLASATELAPWEALSRAVSPEVSPGLRLALAVAEDPLGVAVDTGSRRLDLGLAETHRRVEQSQAFQRALAEDLMDQVAAAVDQDWPLERAVRYLLADLAGRSPPAGDAEAAASPLLRRARLDGARSAESLGSLLIAARIWPEGTQAALEELLTSGGAP